jgi:hypothetical protein
MEYLLDRPWLFGLFFAFVLAGAIELGRLTANRLRLHQDPNRQNQIVAIRDWLFILVSLLLGFTLASVASEFAERRSLLIEEAVSIRTTYLRAETLPQPSRDHSRLLLRQYVDSRLDLDNTGLDAGLFDEATARAKRIQKQLWDDIVALPQADRSPFAAEYLIALNRMFDLHDKRIAAQENRVPYAIWALIFAVSLIAAFARGVTIDRRFWLTLVLAPVAIAVVVALVADLDAPSSGLIRLDQRAMHRVKDELSTDPDSR